MNRFASGRIARKHIVFAVLAAAVLAMPRPSHALLPCTDWAVIQNANSINALGPDSQASYWWLFYANVPGSRLRIEGSYPDARFFSFAVQDITQITLGSLRDSNIEPDEGAYSPFRETGEAGQPKTYTIYIDPEAAPEEPAANTFYAGATFEGLPNPGGSILYRVYVPTNQGSLTGSVGLPKITLETPLGDVPLSLNPACTSLPGDIGGPGNELLTNMNYLDLLPPQKPTSSAYTDPPDFMRIHSAQFTDPVVKSLPPALAALIPQREGIPLQNYDFPYLMSQTSRYFGETVVVRFKAPTFPDTVRGEKVFGEEHQVRFWSLCSYAALEEGLIRMYACATDFLTATDTDGWVRAVVSDPAHRPDAVIDPENGVHWLPWGPTSSDLIMLRYGVPDEDWANNPRRVDPEAADQVAAAMEVMQEYYPVARYCSTRQILDAGIDSCFETAVAPADSSGANSDGSSTGGSASTAGGGGCVLASPSAFDPLLPVLLLWSLIMLGRFRYRC